MTIAYYDVIQVGASLNPNNLSYQVSLQSNMKKLSYLANKLKAELAPTVILSLSSIDILRNITSDVGSCRSSTAPCKI